MFLISIVYPRNLSPCLYLVLNMIKLVSGGGGGGSSGFTKLEHSTTNKSVYVGSTTDAEIPHSLGRVPTDCYLYAEYGGSLYGPLTPFHFVKDAYSWYAVNVQGIWASSTKVTVRWGWLEGIPASTAFKFIAYVA